MTNSKVKIVENIFNANDRIANENNQLLDSHDIFSINVMASPGAGKTSFILQTIAHLSSKIRIGVIEGDTAAVTIDADKVNAVGIPAVQINTGGACHLDASMVHDGLNQLQLEDLDLIIIENVGNLICPADFKLGSQSNIVIASIPEGADKPYKYPNIYRGIDVLILNKMDLLPYLDFDLQYFKDGIKLLNPAVTIIEVSSKTGEGIQIWCDWLLQKMQ
jgi:hydrogenase nickel incorporation protein HypB